MAAPKEHAEKSKKNKMGRKRKTNESDNAAGMKQSPEKKAKAEFTEIEFKFFMRDPKKVPLALEQFLDHAEDLTYDLISNYARSSPDAVEIMNLLEVQPGSKKKPDEIAVIFNVLEKILTKAYAADANLAIRQQAVKISKKIISNHLPTVYFLMHISCKKHVVQSVLKLLAAIVMQGRSISLDAVLCFDFQNENFKDLFNRKVTGDAMDVRSCLVLFILSFLMTDEVQVIRHLCETPGVISNLFPQIPFDKASTIQMTLSTLRDKVVANSAIAKTTKLKIFNTHSLKFLAKLYHWSGPKLNRDKKGKGNSFFDQKSGLVVNEFSARSRGDVRQWVHAFLLELCCSHKHGINFFDPQYGVGSTEMNSTLWWLLNHFLSDPQGDLLKVELVIRILSSCPDLLPKYLLKQHNQMHPRQSSSWLAVVNTVIQIFEHQPVLKCFKSVESHLQTDKLVSWALHCLLPPAQVLAAVNLALKHESILCVDGALRLFLAILTNVKASFKCYEQALMDATGLTSSYRDFIESFSNQAATKLPHMSVLMTTWKKSLQMALAAGGDVINLEDGLPPIYIGDHLNLVLQVMGLYASIFPKAHPEFMTLLSGVQQICQTGKINKTFETALKKSLLNLISFFNLSLLQAKQNEDGGKLIRLLFEMSHSVESMLGGDDWVDSMIKLLLNTGYFGDNADELRVWMNCLQESIAGGRGLLTFDQKCSFVSSCMAAVLEQPYAYSERILQVQQLATEMTVEMDDEQQPRYSHLVQDILSKPEEHLEPHSESSAEPSEESDSVISPGWVFTGLVPAAIDIVSTSKNSTDCPCFLHIAHHLLRVQADPLPLALIIASVESDLLKSSPVLCDALTFYLPKSKSKELGLDAVSRPELSDEGAGTLPDALEGMVFERQGVDTALLLQMIPEKARDRELVLKQLLHYVGILLGTKKKKKVEKAMSTLGVLFEIMLKLVEHSLQINSKESASKNPASTSSSPQVEHITSLVLSHNGLRSHFADESSAFSSLVMQTIGQFIGIVPGSVLRTNHVGHFKQRLIQGVEHFTEPAVLSVLQAFFPLMTDEEMLSILGCLLKHPMVDGERKQLNSHGECFVSALSGIVQNGKLLSGHQLPQRVISHLCDLMVELEDEKLLDVVCHVISAAPLYSVCLSASHFTFLMRRLCECNQEKSSQLSVLLAQPSPVSRYWIGQDLIARLQADPSTLAESTHLLMMYFKHADDSELKETCSTFHALCWKPLLKLLTKESVNENTFSDTLSILLSLARHCEDKDSLKSKLSALHEKLLTGYDAAYFTCDVIRTYSDLVSVVWSISADGEKSEEELKILMQFLLNAFFKISEKKSLRKLRGLEAFSIIADVIKVNLDGIQKYSFVKNLFASCWSSLAKNALKYYFSSFHTPELLRGLCPLIYSEGASNSEDLLSAADIFDMILSHSEFLNIMMEEHSKAKDCLVDVLLCLVQTEPKCCDMSHISPLLGAYTASLSVTDRKILQMLHCYESAGCELSVFKPYLWGSKAAEKRAARKDLAPSLLQQPCIQDVIDHLEDGMVDKSIANFPLHRQLQPESGIDDTTDQDFSTDVYDPAFFFPIFHQLLGNECVVIPKNFISSGLLSLTFAGLSSYDEEVRSVAHLILQKFCEHLPGARFLGCSQVQYLVMMVCKSYEAESRRIPFIISIFLCAISTILLSPAHRLYKPVNKWLTAKSDLDLSNVPLFHSLINSTSFKFNEEREWILSHVGLGIRDMSDFRLAKKDQVFRTLLALFNSPLCNYEQQKMILDILCRVVQIKQAAQSLIEIGILEWMTNTLAIRAPKSVCLSVFIQTMGHLWTTLSKHSSGSATKSDSKKISNFLYSLASQMALLCRTLLQGISSFHSLKNLLDFSKCLSSILCCISAARAQTDDDSPFAKLHLSYTSTETEDILCLMHHLNSLTADKRDQTLLAKLLTKAALDKPPEASTDEKDVPKEEDESSNAKTLVDASQECLLEVIMTWAPGAQVTDFHVECILLAADWSLERCLSSKRQHLAGVVQWLDDIVMAIPILRTELLHTSGRSRTILNHLLKAYEMVSMSDDLTALRTTIYASINSIFCRLMKDVLEDRIEKDSSHPLVTALAQKSFRKQCMKMLKDQKGVRACEVIRTLIAEASLGAAKPRNTLLLTADRDNE